MRAGLLVLLVLSLAVQTVADTHARYQVAESRHKQNAEASQNACSVSDVDIVMISAVATQNAAQAKRLQTSFAQLQTTISDLTDRMQGMMGAISNQAESLASLKQSLIQLNQDLMMALSQSASPSASLSPSESYLISYSPSPSESSTPSKTDSVSASMSPSFSSSESPTSSQSQSPTTSISSSGSQTPSASMSATGSFSPSASSSPTSSESSTGSFSPTASMSASVSMSYVPSSSKFVSLTPSASETVSVSATLSISTTSSASSPPSISATSSASSPPSISPTSSQSAIESLTRSSTESAIVSTTASLSPSASVPLSPSTTATQSPSKSATLTLSETMSFTFSISSFPTYSMVSISLFESPSPSPSSTPTAIPSPTATATPSPTPTSPFPNLVDANGGTGMVGDVVDPLSKKDTQHLYSLGGFGSNHNLQLTSALGPGNLPFMPLLHGWLFPTQHVVASRNLSMVVLRDSLVKWGSSAESRTVTIPSVTPAAIASMCHGEDYAAVATPDGTIHAWYTRSETTSNNNDGPSASPATSFSSSLLKDFPEAMVDQVLCGPSHTTYLSFSIRGEIRWVSASWLNSDVGSRASNTQMEIKPLSRVIDVATGYEHSIFLMADRQVYGMGDNRYGQIAQDASVQHVSSPVLVSGLDVHSHTTDNVQPTKIFCGPFNSFVKMSSGDWYAWGNNNAGQLCMPHGSTAATTTETETTSGGRNTVFSPSGMDVTSARIVASKIDKIAAANEITILLTNTGDVYGCGNTQLLGSHHTTGESSVSSPTLLLGFDDHVGSVVDVMAGWSHVLMLYDNKH